MKLKQLLAATFLAAIMSVPKAHAAGYQLNVSAWLPTSWDTNSAQDSFESNLDLWNQINPFWYQVQDNGTLVAYQGARSEKIKAICQKYNILMIPTVTNSFDPERVKTIINDVDIREYHINNLVKEVTDNGYDGIELDYEGIYPEDKNTFTTFIKLVAEKLHAKSKKLSLAVQAKKSDLDTWKGPGATDYASLGQYADFIKIMAYDAHWPASDPGAIAPVPWIEKILTYAVQKVPRAKIYLGIPFYGYDWRIEYGQGEQEEGANSRTYNKMREIFDRYNPDVRWSSEDSAPTMRYLSQIDGKVHEIWYENPASIRAKVHLAKEYKIGGVNFWRLGSDDPRFFEAIREEARSQAIANKFSDIPKSHWVIPYANELKDMNLIWGYPDGGFRPEQKVQRDELIKIVINAFDYPLPISQAEKNAEPKLLFGDVKTNYWAYPYIQKAFNEKLVSGYRDNLFSPQKLVTRAEAIKIILGTAKMATKSYPKRVFQDLEAWMVPYVETARELGIVRSGPSFYPNTLVTRSEMAKMVVEVIRVKSQ